MLEHQNALTRLPATGPADLDQRIAVMLDQGADRDRQWLGGLRAIPVLSDNMEPTLRRGDFVFAAPARAYQGEGIYATSDHFGSIVLHRFERCGRGRIRLWSDNPLYTRYEISLDAFLAEVVGKVVITAKVVDRCLLPDALRV